MRTITAQNADVTIAGTTLVSNVQFLVDNTPEELDLPSGAFFIWPLRQGQLTLQHILDPGAAFTAPITGPATPTPTTISFTTNALDNSGVVTISTDNAFLTGVTIGTIRIQEMPILQQTLVYTVLVDDALETDY